MVELTEDGADADIDELSKRYIDRDSYPFRRPGEWRILVIIEPEKVPYGMP